MVSQIYTLGFANIHTPAALSAAVGVYVYLHYGISAYEAESGADRA